jgi:protein CWC15
MTTANRPTWHARVGASSSLSSSQLSSKDLNGFTQMKYRQVGQSSKEEMIHKDLKTELAIKEESLLIKNDDNYGNNNNSNSIKKDMPRLLTYKPIVTNDIINKYDDADADADDKNSDDDLESSDDDDDDDEDDEMELLRELERIKAERALAQEKKEREEREESERKSKER